MKLNENQSEMFFIVTREDILERYNKFMINKEKIRVALIQFGEDNGIGTNEYYTYTHKLCIVPSEEDKIKFSADYLKDQPGQFKKSSALSRAWVSLCEKEGLKWTMPIDIAHYSLDIEGKRTTRLFKDDGILYGCIQAINPFSMPSEGFSYMWGSLFYKKLEEMYAKEPSDGNRLY